MKAILFLVVGVISITTTFGQNKTVLGTDFKLSEETSGKGYGFLTIGSDGKNTYSMSIKGVNISGIPVGYKVILNKFDSKMNRVLYANIPKKSPYYKIGMYKAPPVMRMIGDHLIQIADIKDKKTQKNTVTLIEYDKNTLQQKKFLTLGTFTIPKKGNFDVMDFIDKTNKNEFVVFVASEKGDKMFVIDSDLNISYEKEMKVLAGNGGTTYKNFIIREDKICFSAIQEGGKKESDKTSAYVIDRKEDNVESFELTINDVAKRISDFEYALDGDKLHVSGFYLLDKVNDPGGAFTQVYDINSGELVSQSEHAFTFNFLTENMSDRKKEKTAKRMEKGKDVDSYEYLVRDVIVNDDGSSILIGERFMFYVTTTTDSKGNTRTVPHYIHADLIMMKTGKDGEILWVERYKKFNHSSNPYSGQYIFHHTSDKFYIVYMEDADLKIASFEKEDCKAESKIVFDKKMIGKYTSTIGLYSQQDERTYNTQFQRIKKTRVLSIQFPENE